MFTKKIYYRLIIYITFSVIFPVVAFAQELDDDVFAKLFNPILDIVQNTLLKGASIASIVIFSIMLALGMIERSETKMFIRIVIAIAIGFNGADFVLSIFGVGLLI